MWQWCVQTMLLNCCQQPVVGGTRIVSVRQTLDFTEVAECMTDNKKIIILGGGTFSHLRPHMALAAPAFGQTAQHLLEMCCRHMVKMDPELVLTRMAGGGPDAPMTNADIERLVDEWIEDTSVKIIFFSAAMCDFDGQVLGAPGDDGKYGTRLSSRDGLKKLVLLSPADKVISKIRKDRKDIFLVGFKTTSGASEDEQYIAGLHLLKGASCNLVLANDTKTRTNMIVTPEEARYHVTTNRMVALANLVQMTELRSHLTFTRSTVVAGEPVPWSSERVPASLRAVVDHCINRGAYKPFRGATVGHFAVKLDNNMFLTSRRKTNFNDLDKVGLVLVRTSGPDNVIAYGSKPSVGGQSQRIIFNEHDGYDCIVHFHCPLKENPVVAIPVRSQREFECGSHQCGQNTSDGFTQFGPLKAVMLDQHGPNILFKRDVDPQTVIEFIEDNFDLDRKTGGYVSVRE